MKMKKIAALTLTAALVLSLTACGGGFKSTASKYSKAFADLDYEEIEADDVEDFIEDEESTEDGIYFTVTDEDTLETILDGYDDNVDSDDVKSIFYAAKDTDDGFISVVTIEFKDKDSAADYYDDQVDELNDQYDEMEDEDDGDYALEEGKNDIQLAYLWSAKEYDIYIAEYVYAKCDGNIVTAAVVVGGEKKADVLSDFADFCEATKTPNAADILE